MVRRMPRDTRLVLQQLDGMGGIELIADIGAVGSCARIQRSLWAGFYCLTAAGVEGCDPEVHPECDSGPEPNEGNGRLEVGEE